MPTQLQQQMAAASLCVVLTVSQHIGVVFEWCLLAGRQKALVARNEQLQKLVEESGKRAALPDGRPRTAPLVRCGQPLGLP